MRLTISTILLFFSCFLSISAQSQYQKAKDAYDNNDIDKAKVLLKPLIDKGDADAMCLYGAILGDEGNFKDAVPWLTKSAQKNNAKSMRLLGIIYSNGLGVKQDDNIALEWYRKGAKLNDMTSLYMLGYAYDKGWGNLAPDKKQAIYWYKKAVEQNSNEARVNLSILYYEEGYDKSYFKPLLEDAYKNGDKKIAPRQLARRVYNDNPSKAVAYYRIAAENGDATAQYELGRFFEEGKAVNVDYAEAVKWYLRASEQGDWNAQSRLGSCYEKLYRKTMDERHLKLALKWYYKSTEDDHVIYIGDINKNNPDNWTAEVETPMRRFYDEGVLDAHKYKSFDDWCKKVVEPLSLDSDVDVNIPQSDKNNSKTYVLVFANENYDYEQFVPYAENDGTIFAKYCRQTLGVPEGNIHLVVDGTLNKMKREMDWLTTTAGSQDANLVILYFSGHGVPDESLRTSYLLPSDGFAKNPTTGYDLNEIYNELGKTKAKVVVLLDACFSGTKRNGEMLVSSRGVAIKPKDIEPKENMIVVSACQGNETAFPYEDQKHGLFTYYLLKKLQSSNGNANLGEIFDFVKQNVSTSSVKINNKPQTPSISKSSRINTNNLKLY